MYQYLICNIHLRLSPAPSNVSTIQIPYFSPSRDEGNKTRFRNTARVKTLIKIGQKFNIFTYFSQLRLNLHIIVFPFISFFIPFFSPTFLARHSLLCMCKQNKPTYIRITKFIPTVLINYICVSSLEYSLNSTTCFGSFMPFIKPIIIQ